MNLIFRAYWSPVSGESQKGHMCAIPQVKNIEALQQVNCTEVNAGNTYWWHS